MHDIVSDLSCVTLHSSNCVLIKLTLYSLDPKKLKSREKQTLGTGKITQLHVKKSRPADAEATANCREGPCITAVSVIWLKFQSHKTQHNHQR